MTDRSPAVQPPADADPRWAEKIKQAKAAREQGKQLRAGRSAVFSQRRRSRAAN